MSDKIKIESITVSFKTGITSDSSGITRIQIQQYGNLLTLTKEQALSLVKVIQARFGE